MIIKKRKKRKRRKNKRIRRETWEEDQWEDGGTRSWGSFCLSKCWFNVFIFICKAKCCRNERMPYNVQRPREDHLRGKQYTMQTTPEVSSSSMSSSSSSSSS